MSTSNMTWPLRRLGAPMAAVAFVLTAGTVTHDVAATAYGLSINRVQDAGSTGYQEIDDDDVSLSDLTNAAQFQGAGAPVVINDDADPPPANAGFDGGKPDNDFTPKGEVGNYARADSGPEDGDRLSNIAEAHRTMPGTAAASAEIVVIGAFEQSDESGILLKFTIAPYMKVNATPGDYAEAELSFSIVLLDYDTRKELLNWQLGGCKPADGELKDGCLTHDEVGTITQFVDPFSVNKKIVTNGGVVEYDPGTMDFILGYNRALGSKMILELAYAESVLVHVPAPASGGLLLLCVVGLAVVRHRRVRRDPARR